MEDIEYTTCVPYIESASEIEVERRHEERRHAEQFPWVLQEEGVA
jgi:hypothetical protein